MNRNEVPSAGIRARMADAGVENAEIHGTYDHPNHCGDTDWRLTLWQVGDVRAAETNADPVFESDDPEAFAELLAEYGIRVVTVRTAYLTDKCIEA